VRILSGSQRDFRPFRAELQAFEEVPDVLAEAIAFDW
jgi:hypothetical protein